MIELRSAGGAVPPLAWQCSSNPSSESAKGRPSHQLARAPNRVAYSSAASLRAGQSGGGSGQLHTSRSSLWRSAAPTECRHGCACTATHRSRPQEAREGCVGDGVVIADEDPARGRWSGSSGSAASSTGRVARICAIVAYGVTLARTSVRAQSPATRTAPGPFVAAGDSE